MTKFVYGVLQTFWICTAMVGVVIVVTSIWRLVA